MAKSTINSITSFLGIGSARKNSESARKSSIGKISENSSEDSPVQLPKPKQLSATKSKLAQLVSDKLMNVDFEENTPNHHIEIITATPTTNKNRMSLPFIPALNFNQNKSASLSP